MSAVPCPICRSGALLRRHCPETNTTCGWASCPRCKVTLDRRRRRGLTKENRPVVWPAEGG